MSIPTDKTVQAGCLIDGMFALLAESLDYAVDEGYEISFVAGYAPSLYEDDPWGVRDYESWTIVSLCYLVAYDMRCVLSREGQVRLYGPGGKPDHSYQIPEAGVFGDTATGLGYVNRIRAIGDHLYVCGQSRQVYRFDWDGSDLSSGVWRDVAGAMRQPPIDEPPDNDDDEALNAWLDANDAIDLRDIDGSAENDIYAIGDEVWHWDGSVWRQLALPSDEPLNAIKVIDAQRVAFVGHNGTVLLGNAQDGFTDLSSVDDNQNFTGAEWFQDRLFLASNVGLYTYDPAIKRIERYRTNLQPDLKDSHQLEAKEGVLWSFGFKDLAYCDGGAWVRVDHPDNPPIR